MQRYILVIEAADDAVLKMLSGPIKAIGRRPGFRTGPLLLLPDLWDLAARACVVESVDGGKRFELHLVAPGTNLRQYVMQCWDKRALEGVAGNMERVVANLLAGVLGINPGEKPT